MKMVQKRYKMSHFVMKMGLKMLQSRLFCNDNDPKTLESGAKFNVFGVLLTISGFEPFLFSLNP